MPSGWENFSTSVDSCLLSDDHLIYSAFLMHNRQLFASMALQAYPVNREAQNILHWQFVSLVIALKLSH
jgi:hypothetical protein